MPTVFTSKRSHIAILFAQTSFLAACILTFTLALSPGKPAINPTVKPVLALHEPVPDRADKPLVRAEPVDDASTTMLPDQAEAGSTMPDDILATQQWSLQHNPSITGASGLFGSQEYLTAAAEVVVAVVDSGVILEHEDLHFLPGYDFIHEPSVGNDGDGRDHDPGDPGDWVNSQDIELQTVSDGCPLTASKWHGTAISGVISATSNNATGIAGGSPSVSLLPVRVTGKCGGYVSDLIDGIRWAAGLEVSGVAPNLNPADVINLSVGFPGSCSTAMQNAIDDAADAGAILVTAATNSAVNLDTDPYSPASCENIITVAATDRAGAITPYTALGQAVFMSAPGGTVSDGIITTQNDGDDYPMPRSSYGYHFGTSIAAAHVSSAVANLLAYKPDLTQAQIKQLLAVSAFATDFDPKCRSGECGEGRLNAYAAMELLANDYLLDDEPAPTEETAPVQIAAAIAIAEAVATEEAASEEAATEEAASEEAASEEATASAAATSSTATAIDSVVATATDDDDSLAGSVDWIHFMMIGLLLSVRLRAARKS